MIEVALREALSMAVDDSTGPWELLWDLGQQFPDTNRQLLESISLTVLFSLTLGGQIQIVRWDPETDDEEVLTSSLAFTALRTAEPWNADRSGNEPHLRFYATEAGREAYFARTVHA
jgi:hypothetical protein